MFFQDIQKVKNSLEDDFPKFKIEKTPKVRSINKRKKIDIKKDLAANRKQNLELLQEKQREKTQSFLLKIQRNKTAPTRYKEQIKKEILSLRPSLQELKEKYLKEGLSKTEIELLVNYKNYPYLKGVEISKKQQKFLLDTLKKVE